MSFLGAYFECRIYFNGVVYLASPIKGLVALSALTGKKIWSLKTDGMAARRGLILHKEDKPKIISETIPKFIKNHKGTRIKNPEWSDN